MTISQEAQAAAEAAATTTAAVAAVETAQTVAAVVEAANERVEAANETAKQITEAAMENERGQRVTAVENEVALCRMEITGLKTAMEELRNSLSEIMSRPPEIAVINPPPAKSSSTLPASGGTAETVTVETATLNPAEESSEVIKESLEEGAAASLPPLKRRRLI